MSIRVAFVCSVLLLAGLPMPLAVFGRPLPFPASGPVTLVFATTIFALTLPLHWIVRGDAFDRHLGVASSDR